MRNPLRAKAKDPRDNPSTTPDHVAIVIHNYRWRIGVAEGEPQYDGLEKRLAQGPAITVPTITREGDAKWGAIPRPGFLPE